MAPSLIIPQVSQHFCCGSCGAPVALLPINANDLAYCCQNRYCGRCVSIDCPEALAILEPLELPARAIVATLSI